MPKELIKTVNLSRNYHLGENVVMALRDISLTIVGAEKNTSYKINQSNIQIQFREKIVRRPVSQV